MKFNRRAQDWATVAVAVARVNGDVRVGLTSRVLVPAGPCARTTIRPLRCPQGTRVVVTSSSPEGATSSRCTELPQLRRAL